MNADRLLEHFERISDAADAVPRLRRFVLELAIRGRLLPQDESDTPAPASLAVKDEGDLSPESGRRGTRYLATEDDRYPIPRSWLWTRLGSVGDWGSGTTPSRGNADYFDGEVSWFKSGELNDSQSLMGSEERVTALALEQCSFRRNSPGDVLFAMYGATIGKVAILAEPAVTNQAVVACTPCDHLFNRYLFLFLLSQRQRFHQASEGGAQPNVSKAKVTRCPIPLPPLAEQHRIVAKVDELMALCDRLEAAQAEREARRDRLVSASLARVTEPDSDDATSATFPARFYLDHFARLTTRPEHVKQLRQTILNLAVRGRLVPQDLKDESAKNQLVRLQKARNERTVASSQRKRAAGFSPDTDDRSNRVPTGWVCAPLADIVEVRNGRAYSKNELLEKGTPVLRVGNLFTSQHWYFSDLALEPEKYCDAGDLLYAWSASFGPFLWPGPKAIFHYHIWNLVPHSRSEVSKEYLHRFLQTETARIRSAGHGISMLHMTKEKMERVTVPLPPLAEQQRIVAKVDELMVLCDQLEASLTSAATERARLLEALLHEALAPAA